MTTANALEPIVMLSVGIHSQPGVYALLLGSGVSTGAGLPTAWGVVKGLIRQVAAAKYPDSEEEPEAAAEHPEEWWVVHGDGEKLTYSGLLGALAPTSAARQGLLAGFFEPTEEELAAGEKVPGQAHCAIAALVKKKLIRVIVTTNFDRLIERALEETGIPPQVISRPEAIKGITPPQHAPATVIKLHGDYADLEQRNTGAELAEYPPEWDALLDEVFDRYGLVISGWSTESDVALVKALERTKSRRYPLYWDSRSSKRGAAVNLLAQHAGIVVQSATADELFSGLETRIKALERLAEPPLTTALAVTRLKRYIANPGRRVDLHDLVIGVTAGVCEFVSGQLIHHPELDNAMYDQILAQMVAGTMPLLHLVVPGVRHDRDADHDDLWVECVQRLMQARTRFEGVHQAALENARHFPALLVLRTAGVMSVLTGRDELLLRLLSEPTWRDQNANNSRIPAGQALHEYRILKCDTINALPRWDVKWVYPISHMMRVDLRELLRDVLPNDDEYSWQQDRYEYRVALCQSRTQAMPLAFKSTPGEFIARWHWDHDSGAPFTELDFRATAAAAPDDWAWWPVVGGSDGLDQTLLDLRAVLQQMAKD